MRASRSKAPAPSNRPLWNARILNTPLGYPAYHVPRTFLGFGGGRDFVVAYALGDAGGFAAAAAQVIELRAADLALAHDRHRIHQRREDREHALHAFAVRDFAHGEALVEAGALAGDAHALERLQGLARLPLLGLLVVGLL